LGQANGGVPLPREAIARFGSPQPEPAKDDIHTLLFTPDGKLLISQSSTSLRVWETATGRHVHRLPARAAGELIGPGGTSLSADGKTLATVGPLGVRLWDVATAKEVRWIGDGVYAAVRFSPDGKLLAALSTRGDELTIWEAAAGKKRLTLTVGREAPFICQPVFTSDTRTVITGHQGNTVRFWDVKTGKEQNRISLEGELLQVLVLSPDGKQLAAVTRWEVPEVHLIDVAKRKVQSRVALDETEDNRGMTITFSPEGKPLVAGGTDDHLLLWDLTTGKELRRLTGDIRPVEAMAVSPDGKLLATAVDGNTVRLRDIASGRDRFELTPQHWNGVFGATFAGKGTLVATIGGGKDIHVWDPATGRELRRLKGHTADVLSVAVSSDGHHVVSHGADRTMRVWDPTTGRQVRAINGVEGSNRWGTFLTGREQAQLAPDGRTYLHFPPTKGGHRRLQVVDTETGRDRWSAAAGSLWWRGATFAPGGKALIAWSTDFNVRLLDPVTGKERRRYSIPPEHTDPGPGLVGAREYTLALSRDGNLLAYAAEDNALLILNAVTGEVSRVISDLPSGTAIAFSPDGRTLVFGDRNGLVHLVEVASGKKRYQFAGHAGMVRTVSFSPCGRSLLSGSYDTTALLWDLTGRSRANRTGDRPPSGAQLDSIWAGLAGEDAARAYFLVRDLAGSPKEAVLYLGERLRPVPIADRKRVQQLIKDLDSEEFRMREKATRELVNLGEGATEECARALDGKPSLEARRRLTRITASLKALWKPSAEGLRIIRAVESLELCGTAEARALLARLAKGAPGALMTEQARGALERLPRPR
jgi:WD40 repeat protein